MKTIEEKARKYAEEKTNINDILNSYFAFIAGYKAAQQWISVDDELPEDQRMVLVKTDNNCFATAYLHGKKSGFIDYTYGHDAYVNFGKITHWKCIEL